MFSRFLKKKENPTKRQGFIIQTIHKNKIVRNMRGKFPGLWNIYLLKEINIKKQADY